jgi:hypothetical protein
MATKRRKPMKKGKKLHGGKVQKKISTLVTHPAFTRAD